MGPTEPSHERTAELVDRSGGCTSDHIEAKDASKRIRSCTHDHQSDDDLSRVGEVQWEGVADEGRHAEDGGLPVECQRETEAVKGIPEGNVPLVNLRPCQR